MDSDEPQLPEECQPELPKRWRDPAGGEVAQIIYVERVGAVLVAVYDATRSSVVTIVVAVLAAVATWSKRHGWK